MDDPWANAWGDTTKSEYNPSSTSNHSWSTSFTTTVPLNDEQEADLSQPSWSTGTGIQWAEPSDTHTSLWGAPTAAKEWVSSTYEDIPLGKTFHERDEVEIPPPREVPTPTAPRSPSTPSPTLPESPLPVASPLTTPESPPPQPPQSKSPPIVTPDSPDAFGTFETAEDTQGIQEDPWLPSQEAFPSTDLKSSENWDSGWGSGSVADDQAIGDDTDEWEVAKREKQNQDRHVPPEVLAEILRESRELCGKLWQNELKQLEDTCAGMSLRSDGLEEHPDLTTVSERLIPHDLILPQSDLFSKTFASKRMADALRITRHGVVTQGSPMNLYLASKGSTAWEASIKLRPEVTQDIVLPPGWRQLEKANDDPPAPIDTKKRGGSGILSFFGRKPASPTTEHHSSERPDSTIASTSRRTSGTASPRPSGDKVSPAAKTTSTDTNTTPATTPVTTPFPISPVASSASNETPVEAPPSAVSRFLNRFTRPKTTGPSPRNSLALSSDDLEFLSDIVPSANDEADESTQIKSLTSMIESSPLPTKLPPPLAPPPRMSIPPPQKHVPKPLIANPPRNHAQNDQDDDDLFSAFTDAPPPSIRGPALDPHSLSRISPPSPRDPFTPHISTFPPIPPPPNQQPSFPTLPPAPARSTTPVYKSLPPIQPAPPRSRTPNMPPKRTVTAIMSTSQNPEPTFIPKLDRLPSLPPPPPPPVTNALPPPSRSNTNSSSLDRVSQPSAAANQFTSGPDLFGDGTFEFTSPTMTYPIADPPSSSFPSFSSSSFSGASGQGLTSSPPQPTASFDDFDDFVSSSIRTPSPPKPPAKPMVSQLPKITNGSPPTTVTVTAGSPSSPSSMKRAKPQKRQSRAADHSRTLSLLETAAARQGRWPAPPSPLPEALAPPPGDRTSMELDLFGNVMPGLSVPQQQQQQQAKGMGGLSTSVSSPAALRNPIQPMGNGLFQGVVSPPPRNGSPQLFAALRPLSPPVPPKATPPPSFTPSIKGLSRSGTPAAAGGLSAQDLSFFENL